MATPILTSILVIVLSVHDGDTFRVNIPCDVAVACRNLPVRISGIDAPELHDRRPDRKALAQSAKLELQRMLQSARRVELVDIKRDKYFRLNARVLADGVDVARTLEAKGLARPYTGEGMKPWD